MAQGEIYTSEGFQETEWRQAADIVIEGEVHGAVEVFYKEEKPDMGEGEGPFLREERHLLDVIAERVAEYVRRLLMFEQSELIQEQNQAIMDMSTPVIKLWDEIVLTPLIGAIDTTRTQQMIETLLQNIVEQEALVAVIDVTGVIEIDTSVARNLLKTVDAARMLGAEVIVTGFSPNAAQTLAQLGVDFSQLRTRGSLRAGIEEAFGLVGAQINAERDVA